MQGGLRCKLMNSGLERCDLHFVSASHIIMYKHRSSYSELPKISFTDDGFFFFNLRLFSRVT
jgi:hypothetical protein